MCFSPWQQSLWWWTSHVQDNMFRVPPFSQIRQFCVTFNSKSEYKLQCSSNVLDRGASHNHHNTCDVLYTVTESHNPLRILTRIANQTRDNRWTYSVGRMDISIIHANQQKYLNDFNVYNTPFDKKILQKKAWHFWFFKRLLMSW